ncbi:hypothetical protein [Bacillus sp. AG4(2022)]|uniref:hypothetical protein n=1 Tax=Bacillus sp. AG4(2022) TaxID=2962594 RepID=UPI0028810940|nr:hypothetical protein [Bacillus sp. AG4(2022)]MDT0160348.1 hypothetical protein [Bacillus sp. AG4(2022)]
MFQLKELQMMDYLLKRIIQDNKNKLYDRDLRIVVKINGDLWTGDFVKVEGSSIIEYFIDGFGDIEKKYSHNDTSSLLKKTGISYSNIMKRFSNPISKIDDTFMLFDQLTQIIREAGLDAEKVEFETVLYDAFNMDKKVKLPFYKLNSQNLELISIVDMNEVF